MEWINSHSQVLSLQSTDVCAPSVFQVVLNGGSPGWSQVTSLPHFEEGDNEPYIRLHTISESTVRVQTSNMGYNVIGHSVVNVRFIDKVNVSRVDQSHYIRV